MPFSYSHLEIAVANRNAADFAGSKPAPVSHGEKSAIAHVLYDREKALKLFLCQILASI